MTETRTLSILLNIEVEALQGADLEDAGFLDCFDDDDEDSMTNLISDYSPQEIAELIPRAITHPDNEVFAGSGMYLKFCGVRVVASEWVSAPQPLRASPTDPLNIPRDEP